MRDHVRWMWRFWREHKPALPLLFLLTLLSAAVAVAFPLVFKYVVDTLCSLDASAPGSAERRIHTLVGILLLVGLGRSLKNLYPMLRARMNGVLEMAVRYAYFERVLDKGHRFFLKFRTGDVVTRLTDDIAGFPKIAWFLCSGVFRALESIAVLAFCVAMMLALDVRLALVALAPLPIMMLVFWRIRIALGARFHANQTAISGTMDLLESCFSGIRILKAYNAEERFAGRLARRLDDRIEVEMRVVRLRAFLDGVYVGITSLGQILAIGFGSFWVLDGRISLGVLYAIYLYVNQLVRPMMDIPQLFISGKQAFVCMDRLTEIAEFEPEGEVEAAGGPPVPRLDRVELDDVGFTYGADGDGVPAALEGVSLTIPRGRRVALVGMVGAGKSTLARVLSGELRPTAGRVLVNGQPLWDYDLTTYRRQIGYIPQEALLFSESVRGNVAFGRRVDDRELTQALRIAQVEHEVASFPRGLDEVLGQRGVRVSGGQRQRLAIARAIVTGPEFLVMDDVTAALDAENEEALWDAITERRPDITAVIVTHRIATARRADEIVVLDRGRVAARGSHEELLAKSPQYRRLTRTEESRSTGGASSSDDSAG